MKVTFAKKATKHKNTVATDFVYLSIEVDNQFKCH